MKDDYLEVNPILLYVKRIEGKNEYYPVMVKRKDKFNLTLKCEFFHIKIKHTKVAASDVTLLAKPLLQAHHNIIYTFFGYATKAYDTDFNFIFLVSKIRLDEGYEYRLKMLETDHSTSELSTRLVTKKELSLDKAFAKLVKLNQLFGKEKVKILDIY